jgi:hypothetical protein
VSEQSYESWSQPELVSEVKSRLKAGVIDRSDLDYTHPDNLSMDALRGVLYRDDFLLMPCPYPGCACSRSRDVMGGAET